MSANTGAPEPVDLFEFLRSIEVAAHRKKLTRMQERVARLTAMDSAGATGGGVVINAAQIAIELGITERSVWTHFSAVCEAGWFTQTVKPTRGTGRTPGRRARYQCMRPVLDLGLLPPDHLQPADDQLPIDVPVDNPSRVQDSRSAPSDEYPNNRLKVSSGESSSDRPTPAESSEGFGSNRMKVLRESYEGPEREDFRHSPSGGSPSDELPTTPVPQQPKPQDAREPVDNRTADDAWAAMNATVREKLAAAAAANARHARPAPVGNVRPDRE